MPIGDATTVVESKLEAPAQLASESSIVETKVLLAPDASEKVTDRVTEETAKLDQQAASQEGSVASESKVSEVVTDASTAAQHDHIKEAASSITDVVQQAPAQESPAEQLAENKSPETAKGDKENAGSGTLLAATKELAKESGEASPFMLAAKDSEKSESNNAEQSPSILAAAGFSPSSDSSSEHQPQAEAPRRTASIHSGMHRNHGRGHAHGHAHAHGRGHAHGHLLEDQRQHNQGIASLLFQPDGIAQAMAMVRGD